MNGLDLIYLAVIIYIIAKYRKQVEIAESWKATAVETTKILNDNHGGRNVKLYYHKTDGGAEYLTDKYVLCSNGHKEGIFGGAKYVVRIDGNIEKDAELTVRDN